MTRLPYGSELGPALYVRWLCTPQFFFSGRGSTFGAAEAEVTLGVNYWGTRRVTEALLPMLRTGGRIVNVSR